MPAVTVAVEGKEVGEVREVDGRFVIPNRGETAQQNRKH